jgi:hypothetical protein
MGSCTSLFTKLSNIKKYNCLLLLIITLFIFGCEKEFVNKNTTNNPSVNNVENIDGVLHFQSEESFNNIMNSQSNQTDEQKAEFIKSLNFDSYQSAVEEASACLLNAKTEDEFHSILNSYSNILYINGKFI